MTLIIEAFLKEYIKKLFYSRSMTDETRNRVPLNKEETLFLFFFILN
jgi:hypothetical protein